MAKTITLTNEQIYNYAIALSEYVKMDELKLPIKVGFYLQKNYNTILNLGQEIEAERAKILQNYGSMNEETSQYEIGEDKIEKANKEILELLSIEQDVDIYFINVDWFGEINLESAVISALSFMIEGE